VIGTGERSFTLPLLTTEVRLVDSATHHAIQIADVLAGQPAAGLTRKLPKDKIMRPTWENRSCCLSFSMPSGLPAMWHQMRGLLSRSTQRMRRLPFLEGKAGSTRFRKRLISTNPAISSSRRTRACGSSSE
jgi:hypothetical protein